MTMTHKAAAPILVGVLIIISFPALAQAQLEEIIVTAQKREQGINDVGITVNAFTGEQLQNFGVKSAEGLEILTPGLTVSNSALAGVPVYTIRGVGFNDFTTTSSSTVGLYLDEVSIPYATMSRNALFDVARVEVLKGPQGDLYGRNTTAGQINFVSNKPTEEFEAGMEVEFSRFDKLDLQSYISGSLIDGIRGRLAVKGVTSNGGWQKSLSRDDTLGERDEWAVRALIDVDLAENASIHLNFHHSDDQSENPAGAAYQIPNPTGFGTPPEIIGMEEMFIADSAREADWTPDHRPKKDNQLTGVSAKIEASFAAVDFTSITAFDNFERNELYDTSGVPVRDGDTTNLTDIEVFTQEFRVSSADSDGIYWIAGVFYSRDDISENYFVDGTGVALPLTFDNRYQQDSDSIAAYAHVEWDLGENTRLTLGGRYTEEERDWSGCTADSGDGRVANILWNGFLIPAVINLDPRLPDVGPLSPGDCAMYNDLPGTPGFGTFTPFSRTIDADKFMWKVTLDHNFGEDVLVYGTVSTGFKSGGFNGALATFHGQLQPFDIEELTSYEIGVKATLLDGAMQFNASAFYYDYEDKQELSSYISPIGPIIGTTNVDKSEVYGAEMEMKWNVTEGLNLNLGVAYLDTEITEFMDVDIFQSSFQNEVFFDASGAELGNAPNWQVNGSLNYQRPISDSLVLLAGIDFSYKDDNKGSLDEMDGFLISDYTLMNARVGIEHDDGRWGVTVWSRNITDEYYWHSAAQSNGTRVRLNGLPVTYGITLNYNWF